MEELIKIIQNLGLEYLGRYYSVYRGVVVDNEDTTNTNHLLVSVPSILHGEPIEAAQKGVYGSLDHGIKLPIPKVGDIVYVEFELGIATKALWSYHGWADGETPDAFTKDTVGIITPNGNKILLNEADGNLTIEVLGNTLIKSKKDISVEAENINLIKGEVGIPKANDVLKKLNAIETKINTIIQTLVAYQPTGTSADAATWRTATSAFLPIITQTILTDITSKNIKQPE